MMEKNHNVLFIIELECLFKTLSILLCSDLHAGLQCIQSYTRRCMNSDQRAHFNKLYAGTAEMIHQLCEDNQYQEGKYVFDIYKRKEESSKSATIMEFKLSICRRINL